MRIDPLSNFPIACSCAIVLPDAVTSSLAHEPTYIIWRRLNVRRQSRALITTNKTHEHDKRRKIPPPDATKERAGTYERGPNSPINVEINKSRRRAGETKINRIERLARIATREWRGTRRGISFEIASLFDGDVILDGPYALLPRNRRWRVDSTSNTSHAHPPLNPRFFLLPRYPTSDPADGNPCSTHSHDGLHARMHARTYRGKTRRVRDRE